MVETRLVEFLILVEHILGGVLVESTGVVVGVMVDIVFGGVERLLDELDLRKIAVGPDQTLVLEVLVYDIIIELGLVGVRHALSVVGLPRLVDQPGLLSVELAVERDLLLLEQLHGLNVLLSFEELVPVDFLKLYFWHSVVAVRVVPDDRLQPARVDSICLANDAHVLILALVLRDDHIGWRVVLFVGHKDVRHQRALTGQEGNGHFYSLSVPVLGVPSFKSLFLDFFF